MYRIDRDWGNGRICIGVICLAVIINSSLGAISIVQGIADAAGNPLALPADTTLDTDLYTVGRI
jgi:hypothetical protein